MTDHKIPLRKWVNEGVEYLQVEYAVALRKISQNAKDFVEGMETFLLDPNPVMLALLAILSVIVAGWLSGHFGTLSRRYERGEHRGSTLWAIGLYTGVGAFSGAVLAVNLALNLLLDVGVDVSATAHGIAPWFLAEGFTVLAGLLWLGAATAARQSGLFEAFAHGWRDGRILPLVGGPVLTAVVAYALVFALWTLLGHPAVGPVWVMFGVFVVIAALTGGWQLALFAILGLALVENIELWAESMETLALVLSAGTVCVAIGLPLGIAMSRNERVSSVVKPVLDFMQTMPAFVYLIPGIAFFGIGVVPALVGTVVFALPPVVRLTAHGIAEVDPEVVEASDSFGATRWQTLVKAQLPLARPSIMVGINQTLLLSLSMVVIAALVGAQGLGAVVVSGLERVDAGLGFEGGISIVILAVLIDRVTQAAGAKGRPGETRIPFAWAWESVVHWFRSTGAAGRSPDAPAAKK